MITDKEVLRQLMNIISINFQQDVKVGLMKGKMGMAILFYHYARYTGNKRHEYFPNEYMELVEKFFGVSTTKNIIEGIAGVGWGIDYMIKKEFIDADGDEVLENLDQLMKIADNDNFLEDVEAILPLFSKGIYFLQRSNLQMVNESIIEVVNFIKNNPDVKLPLVYINSIIYVALVASKQFQNTNFYDGLLDFLFSIITSNAIIKIGSEEYFFLKKNISLMSEHQASKWSKLTPEHLQIIETYDYYWIDFLFQKGARIPIDAEKIHTWLHQSFLEQFNFEKIAMHKGLAGICFALMNRDSQI